MATWDIPSNIMSVVYDSNKVPLEALQEEIYGDVNEKQKLKLHNIEESGKHLLALINEILDLAKIEAGKVELAYTKISIDNLCQSALRLVKQTALKIHWNMSF